MSRKPQSYTLDESTVRAIDAAAKKSGALKSGAESRAVNLPVVPPVRRRAAAHPLHLLKLCHGVTLLHDGPHGVEDIPRPVAREACPPFPLDGEGARPFGTGARAAAGAHVLPTWRLVEQPLTDLCEGRPLLCLGKPVSHFSPVDRYIGGKDSLYRMPFPVLEGLPTFVLMYKIYAPANFG